MSRNMMNECYTCQNRCDIPGDAHSRCLKPDFGMTGNTHGVINGWFFYPFNFDPIWKTKDCVNYLAKEVKKG